MTHFIIAVAAVLVLVLLLANLPPQSIDERVQVAVAGTMVAGR